MVQTPVNIFSSRCEELRESKPRSPTPPPPHLDIQSSDAGTIAVDEFLEEVGLAHAEVPRDVIPPYFAAECDLRGCAPLDMFEDLRVQTTHPLFMPTNYARWLDCAIPLSRFFFVDAKWISWGDAREWDRESQKQYEEWGAEEGGPPIDNEALDAQDDCSYDPQPSISENSSTGLFSVPSMEDINRRRTIYHPRPPLIRANAFLGDKLGGKLGRMGWQSTSSFSSTSGTSQHTSQKSEGDASHVAN